jgi:O-antigen/teichoic acid export membrane protein
MAAEARAGKNLTDSFLRAVSILTAFQWPALVVLAIIAPSVVSILLGSQWLQTIPLIQLMAIAALPSFLTELAYPVLVAVGAMRHLMFRALLSWPISALVIAVAAQFGVTAVAISFFVVFPLQAGIAVFFLRRHIIIGWLQLAKACWKSGLLAAASAAGPLAVMMWCGFVPNLPVHIALLAAALAAVGWLAAVWVTRHELLDELARVAMRFGRRGRMSDR